MKEITLTDATRTARRAAILLIFWLIAGNLVHADLIVSVPVSTGTSAPDQDPRAVLQGRFRAVGLSEAEAADRLRQLTTDEAATLANSPDQVQLGCGLSYLYYIGIALAVWFAHLIHLF